MKLEFAMNKQNLNFCGNSRKAINFTPQSLPHGPTEKQANTHTQKDLLALNV